MNTIPFHLTLATTPPFGPDDEYTLGKELALVKAALLYGDRVRLCSPGTSMVMQLQGNRDAETPEERRDHIANYLTTRVLTDPNGDVGRFFPKLQMFLRSENDSAKRERVVRSTVRQYTSTDRLSDEQWEQMGEEQWAMARDAGADGIVTAIDSGLLELHEFAGDADFGWAAAGPERQIAKTEEFVDLVAGAVEDRTTYPVFDADAAQIARWAVEHGVVSPSEAQIRRGQHAALAADLLGRLPTFESASVDEVIAVRRELEGPLVRFRGVVSGFAASISSEPWGKDFELEAEETFVRQVEPSVQEIREAVEANASLASLAAKVGRPGAIAAGLGLMLGGLPLLPAVAALALGAGATTAITAYNSRSELLKERSEAQRNQMYFYYRAGESLGRRVG